MTVPGRVSHLGAAIQEDLQFRASLSYTVRPYLKMRGAKEMAQLVQCLPCKLKDLSLVPKPVFKTKQEWSGHLEFQP